MRRNETAEQWAGYMTAVDCRRGRQRALPDMTESTPTSRTLRLRKPAAPESPLASAPAPASVKAPSPPPESGGAAFALPARLYRARAAQLERQLSLLSGSLEARDAAVVGAAALARRCAEMAAAVAATPSPHGMAAAAQELAVFAAREAGRVELRAADGLSAEWRLAFMPAAGNPFLAAARSSRGWDWGAGGGDNPSVADIASGAAAAVVDGARVALLEQELSELSPVLAALRARLAAASTAEGDALDDAAAAAAPLVEAASTALAQLAQLAPARGGVLFGSAAAALGRQPQQLPVRPQPQRPLAAATPHARGPPARHQAAGRAEPTRKP